MKFYVLYVKTRRVSFAVGGWEWDNDERRERREQRINDQIIMPVPYADLTQRRRKLRREVERRVEYTATGTMHRSLYEEIDYPALMYRSVDDALQIGFKAMIDHNAQTLKESNEQ